MTDPQPRTAAHASPLLSLAAFVIVVAGIRAASAIVVPCLLAVFLAIIFAPFLLWARERGVPTWLALLAIVAVLVAALGGLGAVVSTSVESFTQALPTYEARLSELTAQVVAQLESWGMEVPTEEMSSAADPGAAMRLAANTLSGLSALLSNTFLILLTVIFILLEAASFPAKLSAVAADPDASHARGRQILDDVKRYLAIKTGTSVATGVLVTLWLSLLGVRFAMLWGLVAFLLNYVPNIGSILAAIPAVLLAVVEFGFLQALVVALGYLVVNVGIGSFLEPRILGRGLGLSALVVFVSLVFWGWVLGPVGMLLSVPLTMAGKVALESNPDTRWIAVLLGPAPTPAPAVAPAEQDEGGDAAADGARG